MLITKKIAIHASKSLSVPIDLKKYFHYISFNNDIVIDALYEQEINIEHVSFL